jgi:hypothetical protein
MVRINGETFVNEKKIKKYFTTIENVGVKKYYIPGVELESGLKFNFDVKFGSLDDCKNFISEFHKKHLEREKILIKTYDGKEIPVSEIDGFFSRERSMYEDEIVIISGNKYYVYNKYDKNDYKKIIKDFEKIRKTLII